MRTLKVDNKWLSLERTQKIIRELSVLVIILGILIQFLGLFSVMQAIEAVGSVPLDLLAGGFAVSLLPTLYSLLFSVIGRTSLVFFTIRNR
ncbi:MULTISPECIES: hypothetical protein [Flammeovirga]|uniref:Uncharacterized protein n=1 Tax=Flammeovirga agarivorans TaxID=2726742 RepID=A0A7X8XY64_9BACT|nr:MULTISPECIES: hypothetical protein [Flammeovirga]NLR93917.1 hypothetical protein [Flammeovirga agarivorans]